MLKPVAYLHTLHMEFDQTYDRLTASQENPFGEPGRDYSEEYEVTSTPLYALPEPNTAALQARVETLEAALREVFLHGHAEGWSGNQSRRDVQHVDAEKGWSLYVSNGALEKTIAKAALGGNDA